MLELENNFPSLHLESSGVCVYVVSCPIATGLHQRGEKFSKIFGWKMFLQYQVLLCIIGNQYMCNSLGFVFLNLIEGFLITSPYLPGCMHICLLLVSLTD